MAATKLSELLKQGPDSLAKAAAPATDRESEMAARKKMFPEMPKGKIDLDPEMTALKRFMTIYEKVKSGSPLTGKEAAELLSATRGVAKNTKLA